MKKPIIYLVAGAVIVVSLLVILNLSSEQKSDSATEVVTSEKTTENAMTSTEKSQDKRYMDYSQASFDTSKDKKRVYFFHASWCPTCKAANTEFMNQIDKIPQDVVLFKTDYDSEKELKKKYVITYQHTFVYVDSEGNEIKKWNGGGIDELVTNTK
ncbi:MAG TPA: thioredoxin family protein [Candidatus Nitrosocosmicus sp.]|nr:thioredoxin family protein [Candidatus Nitrosocosmicus sp.]